VAIKTPGGPVAPASTPATPTGAPPPPEGITRPRRPRRTPRQQTTHVLGRVVLYAVLALGSLIFMAPLLWMVVASLQSLGDIFSYPPHWIPIDPSLDNYQRATPARPRSRSLLTYGLEELGHVTALTTDLVEPLGELAEPFLPLQRLRQDAFAVCVRR